MINLSENCKYFNMLPPVSHATGFDGYSNIVDMSKLHSIDILVMTGASSSSNSTLTVEALDHADSALEISTAVKTAIPFKYRYCDGVAANRDVLGDYVTATASGFAMTASKANSFYCITVKASDLLVAGQEFRYVRLKANNDTSNAQLVSVVGVGFPARYKDITLPNMSITSTT